MVLFRCEVRAHYLDDTSEKEFAVQYRQKMNTKYDTCVHETFDSNDHDFECFWKNDVTGFTAQYRQEMNTT